MNFNDQSNRQKFSKCPDKYRIFMFLFTRFHIVDKKLVQLAQILFISSICSVFFLKYNQENLPTNYLVVLNRIINNVTHVSFLFRCLSAWSLLC